MRLWASLLIQLAACTRGFLHEGAGRNPALPDECANVLVARSFTAAWTDGGVVLAWDTEDTRIDGFWITRSSEGAAVRLGPFKAAARSAIDVDLRLDAVASYALTAHHGVCASEPSLVEIVTPPRPVDALSLTAGTDWIELAWIDSNGHELGYRVALADGTVLADLAADSTGTLLAELAPATGYDFVVTAVASDGSLSEPVAIQGWTLFSAPTLVQATAQGTDSVGLEWQASNAAGATYRVERSLDGVLWANVAELAATARAYADTGLSSGTTYHYRLSAVTATQASTAEPVTVRTRFAPLLSVSQVSLDDNCTLVAVGSVSTDAQLGASLVELNASASVLDNTVATANGFSGDLAELTPGSLIVSWGAADSYGASAVLEVGISLNAATTYARSMPEGLALVPGQSDGTGQQPWWSELETDLDASGCFACQGERAGIAIGAGFACVLQSGGKLACWGRNGWGQLGNGDMAAAAPIATVCAPAPYGCGGELSDIVTFDAREDHACAVNSAGAVFCWGSGFDGQLGNGNVASAATPQAVCVSGTATACADGAQQTGVVQVALGREHSCALLVDGSVRCWGKNNHGQLGDGTTQTRLHPTPVCLSGTSEAECVPLTGIVDLGAGRRSMCAVTSGGNVYCWGENNAGQLGDGTYTSRSNPVPVCMSGSSESGCVALAAARTVEGGEETACAIGEDTIYCWGDNGSLGWSSKPMQPCGSVNEIECPPFGDAVQVVAPEKGSACALRPGGEVECLGDGKHLGVGGAVFVPSLTAVCGAESQCADTLTEVVALATRETATCAVISDGRVACWGRAADAVFESFAGATCDPEACTLATPAWLRATSADAPWQEAAVRSCAHYEAQLQ